MHYFYREEWELSGDNRSEEKAKVGTEDQKVIQSVLLPNKTVYVRVIWKMTFWDLCFRLQIVQQNLSFPTRY